MKKNKGFTLIELLVVVAIIGILAAVGVVAYNGYTASAKANALRAAFKTDFENFRKSQNMKKELQQLRNSVRMMRKNVVRIERKTSAQ